MQMSSPYSTTHALAGNAGDIHAQGSFQACPARYHSPGDKNVGSFRDEPGDLIYPVGF